MRDDIETLRGPMGEYFATFTNSHRLERLDHALKEVRYLESIGEQA